MSWRARHGNSLFLSTVSDEFELTGISWRRSRLRAPENVSVKIRRVSRISAATRSTSSTSTSAIATRSCSSWATCAALPQTGATQSATDGQTCGDIPPENCRCVGEASRAAFAFPTLNAWLARSTAAEAAHRSQGHGGCGRRGVIATDDALRARSGRTSQTAQGVATVTAASSRTPPILPGISRTAIRRSAWS